MTQDPIIVWLRRDLRLADNPALAAAAALGGPVIPVFIADTLFDAIGAAPKFRFGLGLRAFADRLAAIGSRLILRTGDAGMVLADLLAETGAKTVYWNRCYLPDEIARDTSIKSNLSLQGIEAQSFSGNLLAEPWAVHTKTGGHFRVYTPFSRALFSLGVAPSQPAPNRLNSPDTWPLSDALQDWQLSAPMRRGADVVARHALVGEAAASDRLDQFLDAALDGYDANRDRPDLPATSGLSEPLAYGEISPRQIWHRTHLRASGTHAQKFLQELAWRDFAWHLTYHDPHILTRAWRPSWADFPWDEGAGDHYAAWTQGRTGVELVDAGMRELYATGRMHNRVRMVAASYLTKHLGLHWRLGQAWFADTLTDWDPASNAMGWQWVAGCGPDAAPYFRIFNPDTQAEKFDPQGRYRHRWLSDGSDFLSAIPQSWGQAARPKGGAIVDLKQGRQQALARLDTFKAKAETGTNAPGLTAT